MVSYSGGSGRSIEEAVVIDDARKHMEGIAAEYRYLARSYGEQGKDWRLVRQSLIERDGRFYDALEIELAGGERKTVFFEITSFYEMT